MTHALARTAPNSFDFLLKKLHELTQLPQGWDYGDGGPTLRHVYDTACRIAQNVAFLGSLGLKANAFPCSDGSVYVVFYAKKQCLEIRIWADRTIDLSVEEGTGQDFQEIVEMENVSMDDIIHQTNLLATVAY